MTRLRSWPVHNASSNSWAQGGANRSLIVAYPLDASSGRLVLPQVLPCRSLLPVLGSQAGALWDGAPCGAVTNAANEDGANRSGEIEVG